MKAMVTAIFLAVFALQCNNYDLADKLANPGNSNSLQSHYMFVSSLTADGLMGNLTNGGCSGGGINQADCSCRDLAKAVGLLNSDTYVAWLSASTHKALCRIQGLADGTCSPNSIISWYNRKNELLASSLGELVSGNLKTAVRYNENGVETTATEVFTGTNSTGIAAPNTCSNWSLTASVFADVGDPRATNADWSQKASGQISCTANMRPIYCVRKI